ncbi:hypothetical protein MJO29_005305 [Puccinia striiformis f. sp. tritici]|nr:hypothetical protein MJO29_005305 [Puccinia striiformis f. sp. tritici]
MSHLSTLDTTSRPSSTGPKVTAPKAAPNQPRLNSRTTSKAPKPATKASKQKASQPTPRIVPLPNLQVEIKQAMDANEKAARTKALRAQRPVKKGAATVSDGAPPREQADEALQPLAHPNQASTLPTLDADLDFSGFQTLPSSPVDHGHNLAAHLNDPGGDDGRISEQQPHEEGIEDQDKVDDEGQDNQTHGESFLPHDEGKDIHLANGNTRWRLRADLVLGLEEIDEDELCIRARKYKTYTRLAAEDKVDLDEATQIYHANILQIACKNLLKMELVDTYWRLKNRARGSKMYSNFCRYDIQARRAYADESLPMGQQWKNCSAIWRLLSKEEKQAFNNPNHLSKLPNPYMELVLDTGEILLLCALPGTSGGKRSKFDAARWCRKIAVDMINLGSLHGVKGVVVVVHQAKKKGRALVTAGSWLGEAFLDVLAKKQNPLNELLNFVKGHQSSCIIAGADVPLLKRARQKKAAANHMEKCKHAEGSWQKNRKPIQDQLAFALCSWQKNRKPIQDQLTFALYKALNGSCTTGWPGKDTVASLNDLQLSLRVNENPMGIGASKFCKPISNLRIGKQEQILTALGEGWVHLVRHKTLDPTQPVGRVVEDQEGVDVANTTVMVGPIPAGKGVPKRNGNLTQASGVKGKGEGEVGHRQ